MISVDDIVKLVLALSGAFAIVAISYQLARLLAEATGLVRDTRRPVNNVGEVSDLVLADYKQVRKVASGISSFTKTWLPLIAPEGENSTSTADEGLEEQRSEKVS